MSRANRRFRMVCSLFLVLAFLPASFEAFAESSAAIPWRGYALDIGLFTSDPELVDYEPSLAYGYLALLELNTVDAEIALSDIEEGAEDFALQDAAGTQYSLLTWRVRGVTNTEGNFTTRETQQGFELLYFISDGIDLNDLMLVVASETSDTPLLVDLPEPTSGDSVDMAAPVPDTTPELTLDLEATPPPASEQYALYQDVLDALSSEAYPVTWAQLLQGDVLQNGSKGDAAKGLQELLVALGCDITADGAIGKKTIAALNDVQSRFGLAVTEAVGSEEFGELLLCALVAQDASTAYDLLPDDQYGHIQYYEACVQANREYFYTAQQRFLSLGDYKDSAARAADCVQDWPSNGQVYLNKEFTGKQCSLTIKATRDSESATCVKIYTPEDTLVSVVFIAEDGKAAVKLPAGTYIMKSGVGSLWYGPDEAFGGGADAYYAKLEFDNLDDSVTLESGYSYTLSLEVSSTDGGDQVGSSYEDWSNF